MTYEHLRDYSRWSLIEVLDWHAKTKPDEQFLQVVDGESFSFSELLDRAERIATYLNSLGVEKGDHVALFLHNGADFVTAWLALARLGAVSILLNTELKGSFLQHQLQDSGARLAIVSESLLPMVEEIRTDIESLETVVKSGEWSGDAISQRSETEHHFDNWRNHERWQGPLPIARDIGSIMYTSGTTGPSKGVLMPHAHCYLFGLGAVDNLGLTDKDRYYVTLPLYHANGLLMQLGATLIAGGHVILRKNFSASNWLNDVRHHKATVSNTLGVTAPFIFAQPESPKDRDHQLRMVMAAPNPKTLADVWRERFGVQEVLSGFGMTECNMPVWGRTGQPLPSDSAGFVYDRYFEVKIISPDSHLDLSAGNLGEIVVRPKAPFGFMAGYHELPDKTVEAWQNLWFHTGDAGVLDNDGAITFVDRIRDCIRRRGHNISSFEVEKAFLSMQGVKEVAAYAVPASFAGGEDEIMISLVANDGASIELASIADHGDRVLPRFATPRYIEILDELPKTPTGKIQKEKLRKRVLSDSVWDREAK